MSIFKAPNYTPLNPFKKFNEPQTPEERIESKASNIASTIRDEANRIKRELRGDRPMDSHFEMMRKLESEWRKEEMERNHNIGMLRVLKEYQDNRSNNRKNDRRRLNSFMKSYGYKWSQEYIGSEEDQFPGGYYAGIGELESVRWQLKAPDGRVVSIDKALREIEALLS